MKKLFIILLSFTIAFAANKGIQSLRFKGTATVYGSAFSNFNSGAQFLPVIEGNFLPDTSRFIADFEFSADTYARFDTVNQFTPGINPYRGWIRLAGNQFEFRAGLQKITFGKAQLLRAISWFDTIDPRDPLGLTAGVFAERFRYYIPRTNANIWAWAIQEKFDSTSFYMPYKPNGTKLIGQYGGRIELPVQNGELGVSYNYKNGAHDSLSVSDLVGPGVTIDLNDLSVARHQAGFDGKWDGVIGAWFELAYSNERSDFSFFSQDAFILTEIASLTLGMDYTLGIGNGLMIMAEYMTNLVRMEFDPGTGSSWTMNELNFAALMLSYPIGLFDSIGLMGIMDLESSKLYTYLFWQMQFDNLSFRLSGALTNFDSNVSLFPGRSSTGSLGNMIQLMAIYDFKINIIR
ncbi:MAG: hypothetical protein J7M01_00975 [Candidatus Marinimicrobia bacterium]|nr:hypothetical protein [Candidatus Neomarinimicrobiota bacterium]